MTLTASAPAVTPVLVENHRRFLAFLERRVPTREAAEDILQDAFVRGLTKAPPLASPESVVAWFYRVLRNAIVDYHRRAGSQARALDRLAREAPDAAAPPDDAELFATVCDCVRSLVTTLTPAYADAIRRVDLEGAGLQAFAHEQGITANNAGVRLHRAHRALKRRVRETCATCADHGCVPCSCLSARAAAGGGHPASAPADAGV
jgi:RNA polymerase sigma factor (sigma-70 family)